MENKIARLFQEHDVNISEFARKTGIPYGTLYDIARGRTTYERIGIGTLIKISREFGMTADELLGDYEPDPVRYELLQIFDALSFDGRRALIACARGIESEYEGDGWVEAKLDQDRLEA